MSEIDNNLKLNQEILKKQVNKFRFTLHQGDVLLCETMFDADKFNPLTKYSIDIRDILMYAIPRLKKILSKKDYDTVFDDIDFYEYTLDLIHSYPNKYRYNMHYKPFIVCNDIIDNFGNKKTIKGVECKIGFYINNKPIVERTFYVDGFNPISRYSLDVVEVVDDIVDKIFHKIKVSDINNIWDDYVLINTFGYSIGDIREMSHPKRTEILKSI